MKVGPVDVGQFALGTLGVLLLLGAYGLFLAYLIYRCFPDQETWWRKRVLRRHSDADTAPRTLT